MAEVVDIEINAKVTGAGGVKQLSDDINETADSSKSLRAQLKETITAMQRLELQGKATGKEYEALRERLDGLNDAQDRARFKAGQFEDRMASLPGPLGKLGGGLKTVGDTFATFGKTLTISLGIVGLIVGAFISMREALSRTEEGTAKLNRITEGFTKIMNGLFAIIEPIANAFADLVIGLLESDKVMNGISKTVGVLTGVFTGLFGTIKEVAGFIINVLVTNFKTLIGVAKGAGDVIAGVFTLDWDRVTKGANAAFDAVKEGVTQQVENGKELVKGVADSVVAGFKAGQEGFNKGFARLTDAQKEANKKLAEEQKKAAEERKKKAEEEAKRLKEEELKRIETAKKTIDLNEAVKESEDKLQQARTKIFGDKIAQLQQEQDFAETNYKREKQRIEDLMKVVGLAEEDRKRLLAERNALETQFVLDSRNREETIATEKGAIIDRLIAKDKEDAAALKERQAQEREDTIGLIDAEFQYKLAVGNATFQDELDTFNKIRELDRQAMVANMASADALLAYDKQTSAIRIQIEKAQADAKLSVISDALGAVADMVGKDTVAGKALAIAQATISTYQGATKALAAYPPPFGAIAAGTVIAAGLLNVKKIISTKLPSIPKPGGGSSSSGGGATGTPPSFSAPPAMAIPQVQSSGGANPTSQIANTLAQTTQKPIRAYVVGQDVSSQQALDRKTNAAATF